jgi:hypothetical protein
MTVAALVGVSFGVLHAGPLRFRSGGIDSRPISEYSAATAKSRISDRSAVFAISRITRSGRSANICFSRSM